MRNTFDFQTKFKADKLRQTKGERGREREEMGRVALLQLHNVTYDRFLFKLGPQAMGQQCVLHAADRQQHVAS